MKGLSGGRTVAPGLYWSFAEWQVVTVSGKAAALPGGAEERYLRIPTLGMLLLAPVMGALLVVFLPFLGFALLGREVLDWTYTRAAHLLRRRPRTVPH